MLCFIAKYCLEWNVPKDARAGIDTFHLDDE